MIQSVRSGGLIELSEAMRASDVRMHAYRLRSRATHLPHAAAAAATTEQKSGVVSSRDVELTITNVSGVMMRPTARRMRMQAGAHR
jgi:hypothetical protein